MPRPRLSAVLLALVLGAAPAMAMDEIADPTHSFIAAGAERRELPVRPGSEFSQRIGFFAGERKVGEQTFFANGKLRSEAVYGEAGRNGLCRTWHVSGVIRTAVPWRDEVIDGEARQWAPDGRLIGSYQMVRGTGVEIEWRDDGGVAAMTGWVDGKRNGLSISYYPDGGVKEVQSYRNDLPDGPDRIYHPSHALMQSAMYREGSAVGPLLILDPAGRPVEGTPTWHLKDKVISRAEYEQARAADPTLPPADPR